ncbi:hypothetical protein TNCV_3188111 [Trichonephila clavipes]|nr:hypothetical protein TNCV_3188111 [Trichonephila clavipes]
MELRSEFNDHSDDDNAANKTYESSTLEGESNSVCLPDDAIQALQRLRMLNINYQSNLGEYYTTHQAKPSEVPVARWEGVDGLQFVSQAYPTHVLLDSNPVSMLANPYGGYLPIEGICLQCLHGEDECCHP